MFKKITEPFGYNFNVNQEGIYAITIEATGNKKQFLKIELDGMVLIGIIPGKKDQYYSIPPDWNGNLLKRKNWNYILLSFSVLIFLLAGVFNFAWRDDIGDIFDVGANIAEVAGVSTDKPATPIANESKNSLPKFHFDNPGQNIRSITISTYYEDNDYQTKVNIEYTDKSEEKNYPGYLDNAYLVNTSGPLQLFIVRQQGKFIDTSMLSYDYKKEALEEVKFIDSEGNESRNVCCSYVISRPHEYGTGYDLLVRHYSLGYESIYEADYADSSGLTFRETKKQKIKNGPTP